MRCPTKSFYFAYNALDSNGNRLSSLQTARAGTSTSRSYTVTSGTNQLLGYGQSTQTSLGSSTSTISYTYNAAGDITNQGSKTFSFNAESRLSSMATGTTGASPTTFHCKANCQASRRGGTGEAAACMISDAREWFDQTIKGDPASASQADQAANTFGRGNAGTSGSCDVVCGIYRPNGLPSRY
ncbi:MAG: hypothetical protein V4542_11765 [Pseudomonadota bacterium]